VSTVTTLIGDFETFEKEGGHSSKRCSACAACEPELLKALNALLGAGKPHKALLAWLATKGVDLTIHQLKSHKYYCADGPVKGRD
jgi:hypothetical protein